MRKLLVVLALLTGCATTKQVTDLQRELAELKSQRTYAELPRLGGPEASEPIASVGMNIPIQAWNKSLLGQAVAPSGIFSSDVLLLGPTTDVILQEGGKFCVNAGCTHYLTDPLGNTPTIEGAWNISGALTSGVGSGSNAIALTGGARIELRSGNAYLTSTGTNEIGFVNGNLSLGASFGLKASNWYVGILEQSVNTNGVLSFRNNTGTPVAFNSDTTTDITAAGGQLWRWNNLTVQKAAVDLNGFYLQPSQALVIADNGGGTNAAATLNPTSNYVFVQCNDAQGCDITMGETNAQSGTLVTIYSSTGAAGAGESNFADTAGVSELAGAFAAETNDVLRLFYTGLTWVEISRSNN